MRASVLFEQGTPLTVEDLDLAPPREGEVRVRMVTSGVCHSCLHAADGSWAGVPVPIVLGDEGATVPLDVRPLVTGERTLRGSSYGSARTREDLPRMADLYLAGKLRIDELITTRGVGRPPSFPGLTAAAVESRTRVGGHPPRVCISR